MYKTSQYKRILASPIDNKQSERAKKEGLHGWKQSVMSVTWYKGLSLTVRALASEVMRSGQCLTVDWTGSVHGHKASWPLLCDDRCAMQVTSRRCLFICIVASTRMIETRAIYWNLFQGRWTVKLDIVVVLQLMASLMLTSFLLEDRHLAA